MTTIDPSPYDIARTLRDVLRRIPMNVLEQAAREAGAQPQEEQGNAEDVIDLAEGLVRALAAQSTKCPACGGDQGFHRADAVLFCPAIRPSVSVSAPPPFPATR